MGISAQMLIVMTNAALGSFCRGRIDGADTVSGAQANRVV